MALRIVRALAPRPVQVSVSRSNHWQFSDRLGGERLTRIGEPEHKEQIKPPSFQRMEQLGRALDAYVQLNCRMGATE
jgi:hypothetical protein